MVRRLATYGNGHVLVNASLESICVAVQQILALSLSDGGVDVVAFTCRLAGVPIADSPYALTTKLVGLKTKDGVPDTHSSIVIEIRLEPLEASDEVYSICAQAEVPGTPTTTRRSTTTTAPGLATLESRRTRAETSFGSTVTGGSRATVASRTTFGLDAAPHVVWVIRTKTGAEGAISGRAVGGCYADAWCSVDCAGAIDRCKGEREEWEEDGCGIMHSGACSGNLTIAAWNNTPLKGKLTKTETYNLTIVPHAILVTLLT